MPNVGVYMIANLVVTNAAEYRIYEQGFFPILKRHGGQFVTFDDSSVTLEGEAPPPGRIVIFQFPSEDAAQNWFGDPEYQELSKHRRAGATLQFLTLVHGLPARV